MRRCIFCGVGGILGLVVMLGSASRATTAGPAGSPLLPTPKVKLPPLRPDLHIVDMRRIGAGAMVAVRVKNSGPVATPKSCSLRVSFLISLEQQALSRFVTVPPLKRGESRLLFVSFGSTSLASGVLLGHVDFQNEIAERNEGNNTAARKLP